MPKTEKKATEVQLAKYPDQNFVKELTQMSSDYKDLVVTRANLPEGRAALSKIRENRYLIQNTRDDNKAILNEWKRRNNKKAESYIDIISEAEENIRLKVKAIEDEIKAEKERKRAEKAAKLQKQKDMVAAIKEFASRILTCETPEEAEELKKEISGIKLYKKDYGKLHEEAVEAKSNIYNQVIIHQQRLKDLAEKTIEKIAEKTEEPGEPKIEDIIPKEDKPMSESPDENSSKEINESPAEEVPEEKPEATEETSPDEALEPAREFLKELHIEPDSEGQYIFHQSSNTTKTIKLDVLIHAYHEYMDMLAQP